ncbi:hypothetical protein AM493_11150 [Flavobacterium akiainvivens]|uniref:Uncharacterized protein n=1 Tax=Flavobacterium akiainvivens TaxID=1202724 RepID=A0A0M8MIY3_9FLAO|nr:hypothetical protein [Flavobacterium akiainvivens]KOS06528.1 hypothetical protein AM493_11150 [Flavobacterium akiainvivens]SFQ11355.1 hypothetical protein SAMN05444144_101129 [Flavobacterium akiainvivens]
MAPHTKITIPGLAGLVLLIPALCLFYLNNTGLDTPKGAISLAMPSKDKHVIEVDSTLGLPYFNNPMPRNYRDIIISGKDDAQQLQAGRQLVRKLVSSNDTINGVRFCFGKNAKYNELIKALTLCEEEKASQWILSGNYLYIYNRNLRLPADENGHMYECLSI